MIEREKLKEVLLRHESKIFAFTLRLIGGDKDRAYEIAASACAEALESYAASRRENAFLPGALRAVLKRAAGLALVPRLDEEDLGRWSPVERSVLKLVFQAFQTLPTEEKAFLLMRDQAGLTYGEIAAAAGGSEADARDGVVRARKKLRSSMEGILRHER